MWLFAGTVPALDAAAVDLENLVSPGALIQAHARETKACGDCHERFDRTSQNRLCLRCHEDVKKDFDTQAGLHGRIGKGAESECRICHTEHKGSDADIVGLVPESFDHRRTDFALEGAHAATACTGCHAAGKPYREAEDTCVACHRKDDPHKGQLGDRCEDCHAALGWNEVVFDHAKTKFPLRGRHEETACDSCHPQQRFGKTAMNCVACHRVDDTHRGQLGPKCGDCHDPSGWKKSGFDHGRETRFALRGAHAALECRSCHESDPKKVKLAMDCASCHRKDDDHRGTRGTRCDECHGVRAWTPASFDHAKDTKFALRGAHSGLACELCHVGTLGVAKTPTTCVECHAMSDVHEGTLGRDCSTCHREAGWDVRVAFDHDLTSFPLLALHQLASCDDCHVTHRYGDAESRCVACHDASDVHERRLGPECATCHNPNGWDRWLFDHDRQTDFALTGGHAGLQCVACHVKPIEKASTRGALEVSSRCDACHLSDSPHDDAFGRDCERCHVDSSWKKIERRFER